MAGVRNGARTGRSARLAAGAGSIAAAAALVRRYARIASLPPDAAARLAIIVEELVANLDDHAGLPPGAPIELRLQRRTGGTRLTLRDPGVPYDPRDAAPPGALPPERGGGAGLALVRAWSRIEAYARTGDVNELQLWLED